MQSKKAVTKGPSNAVSTSNSSSNIEKRQARRVLTEEVYTSTLSEIITRDYFPSLRSLQRDAGVLEKRSQGDIAGAVAIRRQARKLALHEEVLAEQERKEEDEAMENGGIRKRARPLHRESVEGFHARVTSEDNHDFEEAMRAENRERRERMNIIHNSAGSQYSQVPKLLEHQRNNDDMSEAGQISRTVAESPMMASDQFTAPTLPLQLAGGEGTVGRNSLFFSPVHRSETLPTERSQLHLMLEQNSSSKKIQDSTAMPPPSSIPSRQSQSEQLWTQDVVEMKSPVEQMVEYSAKTVIQSNDKHIIPRNTRLTYQNESRLTKRSDGLELNRRNNSGLNEYESDSTSTDLDAPQRSLAFERRARVKRTHTDRNSLMTMTPVIIPKGRDDDPESGFSNVNHSPIMTWGDVASTPLVHSGESISMKMTHNTNFKDLDSNVFQLPKVDTRESHAIVAETKLAKQTKKFKDANTSRNKTDRSRTENLMDRKRMTSTYLDRKRSLTPAARSLLERSTLSSSSSMFSNKRSKVNARESSSLSSALRLSYTPKHNVESLSERKDAIYQATPLSVGVDGVEVSESKRKITISGLLMP